MSAKTVKDYSDFMQALLPSLAESTVFTAEPALSDILRNPRMVVVINHATPLSWIPAMALLATEYAKAGGGDRVPRGIADKWFYSNPLTKILAEYITQSPEPQNFDQVVETFIHSEKTDLVIMPEGANTFFGRVDKVQEFRSPRFVEIAIKAKAPILIVAHKGSESWSLPLELPKSIGAAILPFSKFFGEKLMGAEGFNLPLIPHKMVKFSMTCRLYAPALYESDLSENPIERKSQLASEAEQIRLLMSDMQESL